MTLNVTDNQYGLLS